MQPDTTDDNPDNARQTGGSDVPSTGAVRTDGRPFGDLQVRKIVDALEDGATYAVAARAAGVSPRTFLRWRNRYEDLRERVQRAEAESASDALGVIAEAAEDGDWRAASWLLEQRHGYDGTDALDDETVRQFVDVVKSTIREQLDADTAARVITAIGDALEEGRDG